MNIPILSLITNLLSKKADRLVGQIIPVYRMDGLTPEGTLPCDGSQYSRNNYNNLWNEYLVGTKTKYYAWQTEDEGLTIWTLSEEPVVESPDPMQGPLLGNAKAADSHYIISNVSDLGNGQITVKNIPDLEDPSTYTLHTCIRKPILDERNHLLPTCTPEEYDAFINMYGQCSYWMVDKDNGYFRTPKIKDGTFLQQAMSGAEIGKIYNAGLPNITGELAIDYSHAQSLNNYNNYITATGALQKTAITRAFYYSNSYSASNFNGLVSVDIDASRSSALYGASTTVQPVAIAVRYFVTI